VKVTTFRDKQSITFGLPVNLLNNPIKVQKVAKMLGYSANMHTQEFVGNGAFEGATHYGVSGSPGDGPYVEIWLEILQDKVARATWNTPGCPSSVAAASTICRLAIGRETEKLLLLTAAELTLVIGGLPEGKGHYADKAIVALRNAIGGFE